MDTMWSCYRLFIHITEGLEFYQEVINCDVALLNLNWYIFMNSCIIHHTIYLRNSWWKNKLPMRSVSGTWQETQAKDHRAVQWLSDWIMFSVACYIRWQDTIHIIPSSFRFIVIPMLWIYDDYKYGNSYKLQCGGRLETSESDFHRL